MNITDIYYSIKNHFKKKQLLQVPPKGIILDVGSGGTPFSKANVLLEKYLSDNYERIGDNLQLDDRLLINADISKMPFKDKSIDYLMCLHVLEHEKDPSSAILEIQRVAKRGYIETPAASYEKIVSWPFHRWFVSQNKSENKLVFVKKQKRVFDQDIDQFKEIFLKMDMQRKLLHNRYENGMVVVYPWKDKINFEVHESHETKNDAENIMSSKIDPNKDQAIFEEQAQIRPSVPLFRRIWNSISRLLRYKNVLTIEELVSVLVCPSCRSDLILDQDKKFITCKHCAQKYPIKRNILYFNT